MKNLYRDSNTCRVTPQVQKHSSRQKKIHLDQASSTFQALWQLQQNSVCMKATQNPIHSMKNESV